MDHGDLPTEMGNETWSSTRRITDHINPHIVVTLEGDDNLGEMIEGKCGKARRLSLG